MPAIQDFLQQLKMQGGGPPVLAQPPSMAGPLPSLGAPAMPSVLKAPDPAIPSVLRAPSQAVANTQSMLLGDQAKLQHLKDTGDGISQIQNPFLHGLARTGDVLESILAPGANRITPGTAANHERLLGQQAGQVNNDLGNEQSLAKTAQDQALTDYTTQRPAIEQSRIDQKQTAVQERVAQAAAARGQKVTWDENGLPSFADDHDSQAFADHQALSTMHQATADKSKIMADIAQNHYIPGTPEFAEAQKKLAQVDQRLKVGMASLGLRAQGLELRRENTDASLYGTDTQGHALPGAAQITGDDGSQTTVGQKFAPTAIKQQKNVTSFNDLTGSVSHLRDAIKAYESEGGDMSDARLAAAASDPHSVVGKVINGKMVTAGLSPAALTLLNAQRQTMEQAGILRSTTGGTSSEAGAQRILAVVPQFGADTNKSAYNKLTEQENVLSRLAPGQTHVAGGASVKHPGQASGSPSGIQVGQQVKLRNGSTITVRAVHPDGSFE